MSRFLLCSLLLLALTQIAFAGAAPPLQDWPNGNQESGFTATIDWAQGAGDEIFGSFSWTDPLTGISWNANFQTTPTYQDGNWLDFSGGVLTISGPNGWDEVSFKLSGEQMPNRLGTDDLGMNFSGVWSPGLYSAGQLIYGGIGYYDYGDGRHDLFVQTVPPGNAPEPSSLVLMGSGMVVPALWRRRPAR